MTTSPTVLFATDLEGDVTRGLSLASALAEERAATLLVVHVVPLRASDGEGMLHTGVDLMKSARHRDLHALSRSAPDVPHRTLLRIGEPAEELAQVAWESRAALGGMEARERSALRRMFGPGLVERLRARVDCPIVTYQPHRADSHPASTSRLEDALPPSVALQSVLDARVDALLGWLDAQADAVASVAERPSIQRSVARLAAGASQRERDELVLELGGHLREVQGVGVELWLGDGGIDATSSSSLVEPLLCVGLAARPGPERDAWISAAMREGAAVSFPIDASDPAQAPVVLASARVPLPGGAAAALAFTFDARADFLRILAQPGPSSSAETYAFDQQGLMLSNSRFPVQLQRAGLLAPSAQAARRVRVSDPGISLLDAPAPDATEAWPLTEMAAEATAGRDGVNVHGYRDYRGVPVIGAWRWISSHRIGVAAEMDVTDARGAQFSRA
ncbi:MAG: universal stress protein [Sandaracinaceae bacterium]